MLSDYLNEETILLQQEATDREDAIRKACQPLCENGSIGKEYVDDAIKAIEELGPYMVIVPGIALIHARPSKAVKKNCMSLMTLKTPIVFGNTDNDPVKIIFSLATTEADGHLEVLGTLPGLLENQEFMDLLTRCNDVSQLKCYLNNI